MQFYALEKNHMCKTICAKMAKAVEELLGTVKLSNTERFDKEQIGIKEPFPVTNLPFTS